MIAGIAVHFPARVQENEELAGLSPGWTADKVYQKTGIRRRRVAQEGECASDLAAAAAEKLLRDRDRSTVDFLLFCTQTPDYLVPTTACVLQHRLNLPKRCGALDFNLGCSGYVYGLALAQSLITGGIAANVLLLTAETYTRHLHPADLTVRTIFGDAGAATLLSAEAPSRLRAFVLGTDGSGAGQLMIKAGGARHPRPNPPSPAPADEAGHGQDPNCLYMDGPGVFDFAIEAVPDMVQQVISKAGLQFGDIDSFIFHQANAHILEHLRRKLRIPRERLELCLEECGNTVSSTIPIALHAAVQAGRIKPGMKVLLAGFGAGLSWAGCLLDWAG